MPRAWEMTKGGIAFRVGNEGAGRGLWVTMRGASGAHKGGGGTYWRKSSSLLSSDLTDGIESSKK